MRSKDRENWIKLLDKNNIPFKIYQTDQYINSEAIKQGAVFAIEIRGSVDLNFNKNGKLIGTNTHAANSFKSR